MKAWLMSATALVVVACGSGGVTQPPIVIPRNAGVDGEVPADGADAGVTAKAPPFEVTETWWGTIALPNDLVDIVVTFTREGSGKDATLRATFAVPAMQVKDVPLERAVLQPDFVGFALMKQPPRPPEIYALKRSADEAEGLVDIGQQRFFVRMVRQHEGKAPRIPIARPQTPLPPYPYSVREVSIAAPEDGTLAGTLSLPAGAGPFPAVLFISGSGLQDRDQNVFGHRTFRVLGDRLTRAGFAVLRVDDRGAGASKGKLGTIATDIGDTRAAFEWLMAQPEIDKKRVGLLGHSVGGVVAPVVAAQTGKAAFVVALAPPGLPGWELIPLQLAAMMDAAGVKPEVAARVAAAQRKVGKAMIGGKADVVKAALRASIVEALAAMGGQAPTDAQLEASVAAKLPEVEDPWTVSFFKEDPRPAWRKVKCPVLALWGEKDLQVPPAANLKEVTAALKKGRNKDVTATVLPGLNHLYQHAETGTVDEYARLEETFDPATLDAIESWMKERVAR